MHDFKKRIVIKAVKTQNQQKHTKEKLGIKRVQSTR